MENLQPESLTNPYVDSAGSDQASQSTSSLFNQSSSVKPISTRIWTWLDFLFIHLAIAGFFIIGLAIIIVMTFAHSFSASITEIANSLTYYNSIYALTFIAFVGSVYLLGPLRKRLSWRTFGFRSLSMRWFVGALLIGIALFALSRLVYIAGTTLIHLTDDSSQYDFGTTGISLTGLAFKGLLDIIGVACIETIYFRGFLYTFLRERWGIWLALGISSFIATLLNGATLATGVPAFVVAVIVSYTFERSKTLWTVVVISVVINAIEFIAYLSYTNVGHIPLF